MSHTLIEAIEEQNNIGWDHFIKGRLSKKWHRILPNTLQYKPSSKHLLKPEQWAKQMICINWKYVLELWNNRNLIVHREENNQQLSSKKMTYINHRIAEWDHFQNSPEYDWIISSQPTTNNQEYYTTWMEQTKSLLQTMSNRRKRQKPQKTLYQFISQFKHKPKTKPSN